VQSHESLRQILQKAGCAAAADSAKAWKLSAHLKSKVSVFQCNFFLGLVGNATRQRDAN